MSDEAMLRATERAIAAARESLRLTGYQLREVHLTAAVIRAVEAAEPVLTAETEDLRASVEYLAQGRHIALGHDGRLDSCGSGTCRRASVAARPGRT